MLCDRQMYSAHRWRDYAEMRSTFLICHTNRVGERSVEFGSANFPNVHLRTAPAHNLEHVPIRRGHFEGSIFVPQDLGRIFDHHRSVKCLSHVTPQRLPFLAISHPYF